MGIRILLFFICFTVFGEMYREPQSLTFDYQDQREDISSDDDSLGRLSLGRMSNDNFREESYESNEYQEALKPFEMMNLFSDSETAKSKSLR